MRSVLGQVTLACDNIAVGRSVQHTLHYPNPSWDHFDVLQAIFRLFTSLPIHIRFRHVEGHQSTKYPQQQLDDWAMLNEKMDGLAKAYLEHSIHNPPLGDKLEPSEWYLRLGDNKICRK